MKIKTNISIETIANPVVVYFGIWLFMISFYYLKIIDYGQLSSKLYLSLFLSGIGITTGLVLANLYRKIERNRGEIKRTTLFPPEKRVVLLYKLMCVLGIIGVLLAFYKVFSQVSLNTFLNNQATIKSDLPRSTLAAYLTAFPFVAIPLGVIIQQYYKKTFFYPFFALSLTILFSLSFWSRLLIATALILLLSSYLLIYITKNKRKIKTIKILLLLMICFVTFFIFMCWSIELRVLEYGKGYDPSRGIPKNENLEPILEFLEPVFGSKRAIEMSYAYFAASLPTLDYWINKPSVYGYGQATFPYIYRLLDKLNYAEHNIVGDVVLGSGMQLPSFIGYAYIDFGFMGIFMYSLILGFFSQYFYKRYLRTGDPLIIMYLAWIYGIIAVSVQMNLIAGTQYIIILFIIFLVNQYLKRKNEKGS